MSRFHDEYRAKLILLGIFGRIDRLGPCDMTQLPIAGTPLELVTLST